MTAAQLVRPAVLVVSTTWESTRGTPYRATPHQLPALEPLKALADISERPVTNGGAASYQTLQASTGEATEPLSTSPRPTTATSRSCFPCRVGCSPFQRVHEAVAAHTAPTEPLFRCVLGVHAWKRWPPSTRRERIWTKSVVCETACDGDASLWARDAEHSTAREPLDWNRRPVLPLAGLGAPLQRQRCRTSVTYLQRGRWHPPTTSATIIDHGTMVTYLRHCAVDHGQPLVLFRVLSSLPSKAPQKALICHLAQRSHLAGQTPRSMIQDAMCLWLRAKELFAEDDSTCQSWIMLHITDAYRYTGRHTSWHTIWHTTCLHARPKYTARP